MRRITVCVWACAVSATCLVSGCGVAGQQPEAQPPPAGPVSPPRVTRAVVCLATVGETVRLYQLRYLVAGAGTDGEWRLSMTAPASAGAPLDVALPGAAPVVAAASVTLAYRAPAAGIAVRLETSAAGATLDVAVDPAQTPGGERMSTGGIVRLPPCRIDAS